MDATTIGWNNFPDEIMVQILRSHLVFKAPLDADRHNVLWRMRLKPLLQTGNRRVAEMAKEIYYGDNTFAMDAKAKNNTLPMAPSFDITPLMRRLEVQLEMNESRPRLDRYDTEYEPCPFPTWLNQQKLKSLLRANGNTYDGRELTDYELAKLNKFSAWQQGLNDLRYLKLVIRFVHWCNKNDPPLPGSPASQAQGPLEQLINQCKECHILAKARHIELEINGKSYHSEDFINSTGPKAVKSGVGGCRCEGRLAAILMGQLRYTQPHLDYLAPEQIPLLPRFTRPLEEMGPRQYKITEFFNSPRPNDVHCPFFGLLNLDVGMLVYDELYAICPPLPMGQNSDIRGFALSCRQADQELVEAAGPHVIRCVRDLEKKTPPLKGYDFEQPPSFKFEIRAPLYQGWDALRTVTLTSTWALQDYRWQGWLLEGFWDKLLSLELDKLTSVFDGKHSSWNVSECFRGNHYVDFEELRMVRLAQYISTAFKKHLCHLDDQAILKDDERTEQLRKSEMLKKPNNHKNCPYGYAIGDRLGSVCDIGMVHPNGWLLTSMEANSATDIWSHFRNGKYVRVRSNDFGSELILEDANNDG